MKKQLTPIKLKNCYAAAKSAFFLTTVLLFITVSVSAGVFKAGKPLAKAEKKLNGGNSGSPPTVSYSGGVHTYTNGTAITPIVPTSSGVSAFGAWGSPTALAGTTGARAVTVDRFGNIYFTSNVNGYVKKIPAGGGSPVAIGPYFSELIFGITTDNVGDIYVVGYNGDVVKIYASNGASLTIFSGGTQSAVGIAIDNVNNLFVLYQNGTIMKNGSVFGTNIPTFTAITLDALGNLYGAGDGRNLYKINANLTNAELLGSFNDGVNGLVVDNGNNIYATDPNREAIEALNLGTVLASSDLNEAYSLAIDSVGDLFTTGGLFTIGGAGTFYVFRSAPTGGYFITPALPAGLSFDSNTGTISGTPTAASAETTYTVTAYNTSGNASTTLIIKTSTDPASLSNLSISPGTLTPAFVSATKNYTTSLPHADSVITITPTASVSGASIKVNGTTVASSTASANIPLITGANAIPVVVTAPDGVTTETYTVTANRAPQLDQLTVSVGTFFPEFSPTVFNYTETVPYGIGSISLTPTVNDTNEQIKINGTAVASGSASASFPLAVGIDTIKVVATGHDGSLPLTYTLIINRAPLPPTISYAGPQNYKTNNAITPLTPTSSGTAPFGFTSPPVNTGIQAIAMACDTLGNVYYLDNTDVTVRKIPAAGGPPVVVSTINALSQQIAVDGAGNIYLTHIYNTIIEKIPSGGGPHVNITTNLSAIYGMAVDITGNIYLANQLTQSITKIPANGGAATSFGFGIGTPNYLAVSNGSLYAGNTKGNIYKISTITGATVKIGSGFGTPAVLAADVSGNVYVSTEWITNTAIKMIPANGGAVITLAPASAEVIYMAADVQHNLYVVEGGQTMLKFSPTGGYFITPALPAGLGINLNTGVISGTPTAASPATNYKISAFNNGSIGTANLNVAVISTIATLSRIGISSGTISPDFNSNTFAYTETVAPSVAGITITPTVTDTSARITINGNPVASGVASANIPLNIGSNTINITVTAPDGITTQTYTITVTRTPQLNGLTTNAGVTTPVFSSSVFNYSMAVPNTTGSIQLTPTVTDTTERIKINGSSVASGSASASIPLAVGNDTLNVVVTGRDGSSPVTYTLIVTRVPLPPTISYAGPQIYKIGVTITPLAPTSSGVSNTFGYSSYVTDFNITSISQLANDTSGNIYCLSGTTLLKLPAGSSTPVTLATGVSAQSMTVDGAGNVYTALSGQVYKYPAGGGAPTSIASGLASTVYLAADPAGAVYVANPTTTIITVIPAGGGAKKTINVHQKQTCIAADDIGNIYFGDPNGNFWKYSTITTVESGSGLGFSFTELAVDANYNVYLGSNGNLVNMLPSGQGGYNNVTTLPGSSNLLAIDNKENLYYINLNNQLERKSLVGGYIVKPALPPFLHMDINTGIITGNLVGAPTGGYSPPTNYKITAYNAGGSGTANLNITVLSTTSTLSALSISTSTLSPTFAVNTTAYSATVPSSTASITVTPTLTDTTATVTANGTRVTSGTASANIALSTGSNIIHVKVTAQDSVTTLTYTLTITRLPAPIISYTSPHSYQINTAISPLNPATGSGFQSIGFGAATFLSNASGAEDCIADAAGNIYYSYAGATTSNSGIVKIPAGGGTRDTIARSIHIPGVSDDFYNYFCIDPSGNIYVEQYNQDNILKIAAGSGTRTNISTVDPVQITSDLQGNVYITSRSGTLSRISANGNTAIAMGTNGYSAITADAWGNVYVASTLSGGSILKILPDGTQQYIAQNIHPIALTCDLAGNLYYYESGSIRMLIPGSPFPALLDSGVNIFELNSIAITPDGQLYFTAYYPTPNFGKITTTGGAFIKPRLPAGLSFFVYSGAISGTPTATSRLTTYTVNVYSDGDNASDTVSIKVVNNNPLLANLQLNNGTLNPVFASADTSYTASVLYADSVLIVTPTAADSTASITVNGTPATSGQASAGIHLAIGANTISTLVTSSDGTLSKTYTTTVTRTDFPPKLSSLTVSAGMLSPMFVDSTTHYNDTVSNAITSMQVTPTATDVDATITVNGTPVASGTASAAITLNNGNNTITVSVAEPGHPANNYTLSVLRKSNNANLSGLGVSAGTVLSPSMSHDITNFSTSVAYAATSITVTPTTADPNATVTVNGALVTSGTASNPISLNSTGTTLINLLVTAQNGNTRAYTISVSKNGSSNANLKGLTLSTGTVLIKSAGSSVSNYVTSVGFGATSLTLTPVAADSTAVITFNGTVVASGAATPTITLNTSGPTVIDLLVTAQDGITTRSYSITINKTGSSNANCSIGLTPAAALTKTIGPADANFTAAVDYGIDSVLVRPVTADSNATVTVNGIAVLRGSASAPIYLNATGITPINVEVTAQDGVTTRSYYIAVSHTAKGNANLRYIKVDEQTVTPPTGTETFYGSVTETSSNDVYQFISFPVDTHGTVTVNGIGVYSPSWKYPLSTGLTRDGLTYDIIVTSSDKVTTREYIITVMQGNPGSASPVISGNNDVLVHTALSPNGDGIDDHLTIDGISAHPDNTLSIMDGNGAMVYTKRGYDNATDAFDGHAGNGKMQKPGTYYYVLRYKTGNEVKVKSGYVVLKY